MKEYKDFHLFCGSGGAALGFKEAVSEYRGMVGRFRCLGGIDCDPLACKERHLPKALSIEELEMMREFCKTTRERAMLEVFYATGGRLSEIQQLNRDDIDWHEREAKVVGKGSKEREVFFSPKATYHLKRYLSSRTDDHPALFVTSRKPYRRLSKRGIQREFKIIAARAGIQKRVHPHVMRHTMASLTLNNGASLEVVQELLGHANPGTTQIYAQLSRERKKEQYNRHLVQ